MPPEIPRAEESSEPDKALCAKVGVILKRSAPGALKLLKPFAGSFRDDSSLASTMVLVTSKPTETVGLLNSLYAAVIEYGAMV